MTGHGEEDGSAAGRGPVESGAERESVPLLVEVISEGPHCVPCEYAIAAVEYVSDSYQGRIEVRVIETKRRADAARYLELRRRNHGRLPMPSVLFGGRLAFEGIPDPEELRSALDAALARDKEIP